MFRSSEQRKRTRAFDTMVADADKALQHPEVVARLGGLADDLLQINSAAFLPDMYRGRACTPQRYRNDPEAVALLPVTNEESAHIQKIIAAVASQTGQPRLLPEQVYSRGLGRHVGSRALLESIKGASEEAKSLAAGDDETPWNWQAQTFGYIEYNISAPSYTPARTVEVIKMSALEGADMFSTAALIAHEHAHTRDLSVMAPVYLTPQGLASSEFLGYHVADTLYDMTDQRSSGKEAANQIEELRLESVDPELPLTPNLHAIQEMRRLGALTL